MRLINTATLEICEFPGDSSKSYVILSHTWGKEECTFRDMSAPGVKPREGYEKIKKCCEQAVRDGFDWAWVDTCCIDQTSTAELSEAINSMFRWYTNAKICYAYLADVTVLDEIASSRWFTRGWTLQELIAPPVVQFYSSEWTILGSKSELQDTLQEITNVNAFVLLTGNFSEVCVAKRMSWAAKRHTTRVEDQAYSLMGIFGVNMPLIYGEGKNAFLRLQQEIIRVSDDQSLFAWGAPPVFPDMHVFIRDGVSQMHGLFADSPADFDTNHDILSVESQANSPPPVIHGNGVRVQYPVCTRGDYEFIVLACTTRARARACIGIPVKTWGNSLFYARCGQLIIIFPENWTKASDNRVLVVKPPVGRAFCSPVTFRIVRSPNMVRASKYDLFVLENIYCSPHAKYNPVDHLIICSPTNTGLQAAIVFTSSPTLDRKRHSGGIFPTRSFAVVLGLSSLGPWTIIIPILRDAHADADFHEMLKSDMELTDWISCCMTISQLKERLIRNQMEVNFNIARDCDKLLSVLYALKPQDKSLPITQLNLEISVNLDEEQINLVDRAIFVSIDIYEITVRQRASKPVFIHSSESYDEKSSKERSKNYRPNWLTVDQLEWFAGRVP